jgi:tetratricopeptide (TPR) repeat protein
MRINRSASRLSFRKSRRRSGCLSLPLLLGLVIGAAATFLLRPGQLWHLGAPQETPQLDLGPALQAFNRGDLDEAIALSQQLVVAQPDHVGAVLVLARALIYRSYSDYDRDPDREAALRITSDMLTRHPRNTDIMAVHAFALQASGQPVTAAQIAQEALKDNPDHALARMALALSYSGVGSHEVSLRENLLAAQQPGWQLDTQRALALSYSGVGDYRQAIEAVEKAIALNPRLIPLYFERALYARQLGDADAATVAYFQVIAYDPNNAKARLRLCELSSLLRQRDAAIQFCQQVTELAPTWPDGWYQLGREYFLQGSFSEAQAHLNRCSTLQVMQEVPVEKRRFECWYMQGQAAEILGDCESLLAIYSEYRVMALDAGLRQTWIYPPEGPPGCAPAADAAGSA